MQNRYYKNHRIKKKWGQVFLIDNKAINTIIKSINPQKNQTIVEIGPGLGALTIPISNIVDTNSLILIECDPNLVHQLIQIFNKKNFLIFNQDVMTINFFNLSQQVGQKLRLIGNLPYNISTKLIIYLCGYINVIDDIHFMFQKEVAKRLFARPNSKEYSRLSIITQYHYKVIPLFEIPETSFIPIPKVKSMVLRLLPHLTIPYPKVNVKKLSLLTKLAFHQRRKTIRNSLSTFFTEAEITQHGIDPTLRAENITINQYCMLTNYTK